MKPHPPATPPLPDTAFRLRIRKRSDRLMNYVLLIYFAGGFVAAPFYNTWIIAAAGGGACLLIYYVFKKAYPGTVVNQFVLSAILSLFMVQYVFQMRGMYEMYFFAFIGSTVLIIYQEWKLQIPLAVIAIAHLALFGYHQGSGIQDPYFLHLRGVELERFVLHVIFSILIFFISGLWAYLLKRYSDIQVAQAKEVERLQSDALQAVRRQAEAESNSRLRNAMMATSDAIWDRNYEDDTIFWGDGFSSLFGYPITPQTSTIGFWHSKVHPDDISRVRAFVQQQKEDQTKNTWNCEYRFLKADGSFAYVKEKAFIVRNEQGTTLRTIGALQDITELKQNELLFQSLNENLAQEKYYLDCLMDNLPDAIYFKNRESRFMRVSKYMVAKHMANNAGAKVDDLLGKTDFEIQDYNHAKEAYDDEQEIMRTRQAKIGYIEKEMGPGGTERWVTTTKLPLINDAGEVIGTFGISKDITELKLLEKQQNDAMLEKAVAQGRFEIASGVMHDIGNAVVGFGSYLTKIRRLQDPETPQKLKSLALFFQQNNRAMIAALGEEKTGALVQIMDGLAGAQQSNQQEINRLVTEQLGNIARIEEILNIQRQYISGREGQERKPVSITEIIEDSLSIALSANDKKKINVYRDLAKDCPLLRGDRTKLMQLMLSIFKNAFEAFESDTGNNQVWVTASVRGNQLVIQVKDNGCGFDALTKDRFFTKGFTTKPAASGLGLHNGLMITESHNGRITIESEGTGKGAVTTVRLPFGS